MIKKLLLSLAIALACGFAQAVPAAEPVKVELVFGADKAVILLDDNTVTRQLLARMPLKLKMQDYASSEKIAYLPKDINLDGAPKGVSPKPGDVAVFAPWGNLCVYYGAGTPSGELVPLGRVESGLDTLAARHSDFDVEMRVAP